MADSSTALEQLGLSVKEIAVYRSLLELGPTAVRKVAEHAGLNRGSAYEALRSLKKMGLVSYFHKEKHEHFVAEDPKVLANIVQRKREGIEELNQSLATVIPQLRSLPGAQGNRPAVKYYEDYSGVRSILEDVLDTVEKLPTREYAVYSSSTIRPYLYHKKAFPNFTEERIRRRILMRAIAIGPGGTEQGKDERRWLTTKEGAPTYALLYGGKMALISVGRYDVPHGLIIEDSGIYETQQLLFDALWQSLKKV